MHFFRPSFFFTLTVSFAGFFCQILLFCVVIPRVLQTWESLLYPQAFFTLHSFPTFATIQQVLQIWDRFFLPPEVFCFTFLYDIWHNDMLLQPAYKDFLGADNFSLKLQDLPTLIPFKTQPWYICLFESHSV